MERFDRTIGGAMLIDGQQVADERVAAVRAAIEAAGSPAVSMTTVAVGGSHPPTGLQVQATKAGIDTRLRSVDGQSDAEALVAALAADDSVHGLFVQTPLPAGMHEEPLLRLLPPDKDIAGVTSASLGRLVRGVTGLVGPTALGVMRLLQRYEVPMAGRRAVVIGRSAHVGLPIALLLLRRGIDAIVTVAHHHSDELVAVCRGADILICAANRPGSIDQQHVKPGATVIDVGYHRGDDGMAGDVVFDEVQAIAGAITAPGSIGPLTLACLVENTLAAARAQGAISR